MSHTHEPRGSSRAVKLRALYKRDIEPLTEQRLLLASYRNQLQCGSAQGDRFAAPETLAGASAAIRLLDVIAGASKEFPAMVDKRWLDPKVGTRGVDNRRGFEALSVIAAAAAITGSAPAEFVQSTMRLTFGADPVTQLFRAAMLGDSIPPELGGDGPSLPGGPFPDPGDFGSVPIDTLDAVGCAMALQDSLNNLALAASSGPVTKPYAAGQITALDPARACPGAPIWIRGHGFGVPPAGAAAPPNVHVFFGKLEATVVAGSWSDTAVQVIVPANVSNCCVSFVEITPGSGAVLTGPALTQLGDVISLCFGASGARAGQNLRDAAGAVDVAQATCQADGANRFRGGVPIVSSFLGNGQSASVGLRPAQSLELSWIVENADTVQILALRVNPPPLGGRFGRLSSDPGPSIPALPLGFRADPARGTVQLAAQPGIRPWQARYVLIAGNQCGSAQAALNVSFAANVALVSVGGGMRSSFDVGAVAYLAAALPVVPTIFAGSGFGALTAAAAAANFTNPTQLTMFWNSITDSSSLYSQSGVPAMVGLFNQPGQFPTAHDPGFYYAVYDNGRAFADTIALGQASRFRVPMSDPATVPDLRDKANDIAEDKLEDRAQGALNEIVDPHKNTAWTETIVGAEFPLVAIVVFAVKFAAQVGIAKAQADIIRDAMLVASVVDPTPMLSTITTGYAGLLAAIRAKGSSLRIPLAGLESADTFYGDENGTVFRLPDRSGIAIGQPLEKILAASVAFPGWVPAVKMGSQNFVDGSVRDPAPIGAAIDAGADYVIVLQPNKELLRPSDSLDGAPFFLVAARADQMRQSSVARAAVRAFEGWRNDAQGRPVGQWRAPVTVVESTLSVAGLSAVDGDNGLIAIWSDYGYMRAFDVFAPQIAFPDEVVANSDILKYARAQFAGSLEALSDSITELRYRCWYAEHFLAGQKLPFTPRFTSGLLLLSDDSQAAGLRTLKLAVRDAIIQRLQLVQNSVQNAVFPTPPAVPATASSWYLSFEQHPWQFPFIAVPMTPWSAMSGFGTGGTVAAAAIPATLDPSLFQPL